MGEGNLSGTWPTVWYHTLDNPASKAFVAAFTKKYDKPPENHAWIEYVSMKILAQAMRETKGAETDKLIAYFESEAKFDLLKARPGYFRSWDHQLMQEAYPFTVKPKGQAKHKQDFLLFGADQALVLTGRQSSLDQLLQRIEQHRLVRYRYELLGAGCRQRTQARAHDENGSG